MINPLNQLRSFEMPWLVSRYQVPVGNDYKGNAYISQVCNWFYMLAIYPLLLTIDFNL
jgi:hypothetical protein